jgi:hypothetical protein
MDDPETSSSRDLVRITGAWPIEELPLFMGATAAVIKLAVEEAGVVADIVDCGAAAAAFTAETGTTVADGNGLQFKHRPSRTLPGTVMGIILNTFLVKHFRPHVKHSPFFLRKSSSCCLVITDPVASRSVPN